jgi:hypothetical protein
MPLPSPAPQPARPSRPPTWAAVVLAGLLVAGALPGRSGAGPAGSLTWRALEPGLELGSLRLPGDPTDESRVVTVLRLDPRRFEMRLLCARAEKGHRTRTPRQWCVERGALAAINAGMFMGDGLTACGLMRTAGHVNNPVLGRDQAVLVADPLDPALPPAQMLERDAPDFRRLLALYRTAAQNIRIVASRPVPHVVWQNKSGRWSQAAVGQDGQGRMLLLYSGTARNPADLAAGLLQVPLGLKSLMHTEGGPTAALCVRAGGVDREWAGGAASASEAPQDAAPAEPVPNVLAVFRRR